VSVLIIPTRIKIIFKNIGFLLHIINNPIGGADKDGIGSLNEYHIFVVGLIRLGADL